MLKEQFALDQQFWNNRWLNEKIGWDIGEVSHPIKRYIDGLTDKHHRVLIPGCGSAYEAEYLIEKGFTDITLIDISPKAIDHLKEKFKNTSVKLLCEDFFEHQGQYDIVFEQTFFCAIAPKKRTEYVEKMNALLSENGTLVGVLFNREFEHDGPPFGGSMTEYKRLFDNYFTIEILEECNNSIPQRAGNEAFIRFRK